MNVQPGELEFEEVRRLVNKLDQSGYVLEHGDDDGEGYYLVVHVKGNPLRMEGRSLCRGFVGKHLSQATKYFKGD